MNKKTWFKLTTSLLLLVITVSLTLTSCFNIGGQNDVSDSLIKQITGAINTNRNNYLDSSVVYQLPDTVKDTDLISVIIRTDEVSLLDTYSRGNTSLSFGEYVYSEEATAFKTELYNKKVTILSDLRVAGVEYVSGSDYSAILSGFELTITAKDFEVVCKTIGERGTAIVGEVYEPSDTQLVENDVNFYENTGIFDSSDFAYDGTGMVIAVLDTGLDYYHTAFSINNFTADLNKLGLTFDDVAALVGDTVASELQSGLKAEDVFINQKVPFGFDYADGDSEVYPIESTHGTHVSGVIAGKDDTITGVAPNAQLVEMKIFSDVDQTARTPWILNALEDCVILGVDAINMSIGTSCGFSRETDREAISGVYQKVKDAGISLVVAASNSYNSTYGSEKNGNLGLTSNPDSGTVGSPSTYDAALSVASISGVKTPYILYNDTIIYFTESNDRVSEEKHFVDELLGDGVDSQDFEYIKVPGAGRSADYTGMDVTGKIVLVQRGSTTFEEKANVAETKGAAGVIIYNNVSGDIKMNVGDTKIPVCSVGQTDGELLAAAGSGNIRVSRSQTSGPFMSDFSSWGPTPDLGIKPEITAHGGSILSAIPGQSYERQSGTSMAAPNMTGVVTLLRQYIVENYPDIANDSLKVTALVNQLLMSTADIILNTNGLPYSVRKQGAGLANLTDAAATAAYIQTYDRITNEVMDKTKIELGDDPNKTGVYTLNFSIVNMGSTTLSFDVSAYVMTEGVSDILTHNGETTVTEDGYILDGATIEVTSLKNGTQSNNRITVAGGATADVTVTIALSDADKQYLNESFANGMYVEGFIMLKAVEGTTIDLNVPYLAFYGDWTVAPILDLDYFATNKDELDDSIDTLDKTLPDAYATRPIGGLSNDYVSYLGSFYFQQDPASNNKISADRKYISLSNQDDTVNSLRFVWAGMLRNADRVVTTITEDATGEVIFETEDRDIRKSYGDGGSIYPANVDVEFSATDYNLKNNTSYTVTMKAYLDYGDGGEANNLNNEFSFPLVADFSAPAVTDCEFYTEYDRTSKTTKYFAKLAVYDNHYSMGMQIGYVGTNDDGEATLYSFESYITPIYSDFNSTTYVVYELTDYVNEIKNNSLHENTFTVACYDYALNMATYEIELPDEFTDVWFIEDEIVLSPNEVYDLNLGVYPETEWGILVDLNSSNPKVASIVNNKVLALQPGKCLIRFNHPQTNQPVTMKVTVLGEGEEGYKQIDKPVADRFFLTGFYTERAYYYLSSSDRDIGLTGEEVSFSSGSYSLSMFPSEAVTLRYTLDAYFPDSTEVIFESSNESLVTVTANGTITAVQEGFASVSVRVLLDGKSTYYSETINIEIKDPYITSGPSLSHYFGNGGYVKIPETLAITEIGQYAFSNYNYIAKDENDEISEDEPDATKMWYIGDNTITEVTIPEGVKTIGAYAFANLTGLTKVTLPSTLERINYGAFTGCTSLTTIVGLENVKFINRGAFENCALTGTISLDNAVAIANRAFYGNTKLSGVKLSEKTQSIGAYAFAENTALKKIEIKASKLKLGESVFAGCESLTAIALNASVIPAYAFDGCTSLQTITLGKDVAVIGELAFRGTAIETFGVADGNTAFYAPDGASYLLNSDRTQLMLVSPSAKGHFTVTGANITSIADGAFQGNTGITSVTLPNVTAVGDYAFADCTALETVNLGVLTSIGVSAFNDSALKTLPEMNLTYLASYAFAGTNLTEVIIPNGMTVGDSAFRECQSLATIVIGDRVVLEKDVFRLDRENNFFSGNDTTLPPSYLDENGNKIYYYIYTSALHSLTIGDHVTIGDGAFYGAAELETVTLGDGATIGAEAFYNACSLKTIDLSKVVSIGNQAFTGDVLYDFSDGNYSNPAVDSEGYYIYRYCAPLLESIDLSSLQTLGTEAFEYCFDLVEVKLGTDLKEIPECAFNLCEALERINLESVECIGENAFCETGLREIVLSSAITIGKYAFVSNLNLTKVTFGNVAVHLEEGVFAYDESLTTIVNMNAVHYVGDYAFANTGVVSADLSSAEYIGEMAFLKNDVTDFEVIIGNALTNIGDNPFANCRLKPFSDVEVTTVNGKEYPATVYTFHYSDTIYIIDGSLYRVVPNGLELIVYAGTEEVVSVADNTVRISAMAFAGSDVQKVILPYTVASIGHKAFYGCNKLSLISFSSYDAPILEEEYDMAYYMSYQNIPASGDYSFTTTDGNVLIYQGLGIVPYFMWNVADLPTNVYYGANFVDYVGHLDSKILMIRPVNGQNYDSFIFNQYFATVIDGAAAADDVTLDAIAAIDRLPENITLQDEALVLAAREAYNKISTMEQKALVTSYDKLTQAEKRISDLKYLQDKGDQGQDPEEPVENSFDFMPILVGCLIGVIVVAIVAAVVIRVVQKKKTEKNPETSEASESSEKNESEDE